MSDPFTFTSTTPRLGLPNLFAAQAQKEFTVNEAFALIDALLHAVVEGEANDPPAAPQDGQNWIVGSQPTGDWTGHGGEIACHQGGNWLFVAPFAGVHVLDREAGQRARYDGGWLRAAAVPAPSGGATVDNEARAAISGIIDALATAGILPPA